MARGRSWSSRALISGASLLAACGGDPTPPPGVPPTFAVGAVETPPPWSFDEERLPAGFQATEGLESAVACSAVHSGHRGFDPGPIAEVGGDYWRVPLPTAAGLCWIRTGKEQTGAITSSAFAPAQRYLSFAVRRLPASRSAVELHEIVPGAPDRVVTATSPDQGGATFKQVVWDLDQLFPEKTPDRRVRVVVKDDDAERSIEAGDFALGAATPAPIKRSDARDHVWGFADLHAHFFTPMAFGGQVFWGDVHSSMTPQGYNGHPVFSNACGAIGECTSMHGTGPNDGTLFLLPPDGGHSRFGFPGAIGYPSFQTTYHQQAYVDWLRRAWQGGLRIVQADAVNYEFLNVLAKLTTLYNINLPKNPTGDAWNIRHQTQATKDFAALPDVRAFAGIAYRASEARTLAREGKLVLVLGTEVETFGGVDKLLTKLVNELSKSPPPTEKRKAEIEAEIRKLVQAHLGCLHSQGVRHIIPIHLGENAFGSPAVYDVMFDLGNAAMRKNHFALRNPDPKEGITYSRDADWLDQDEAERILVESPLGKLIGLSAPDLQATKPPWIPQAAKGGLSYAGKVVVEEMMRLGMIIDMDHMSALAEDQVLELGEKYGYPVSASHTGFRETSLSPEEAFSPESWSSERSKSKADLERIRALGGLVGVGTSHGATRVDKGLSACDGATPSFVTQVRYAIEAMGGKGVGLGTDINGLGGQAAPRFGPYACWGAAGDKSRVKLLAEQRGGQSNGVAYDPRTSIRRHDTDRFNTTGDGPTFLSQQDRYAWQAAARFRAGDGRDTRIGGDRDPEAVKKVARGFWLAQQGKGLGGDAGDKDIAGGYWGCLRQASICLGDGLSNGDGKTDKKPAESGERLDDKTEKTASTVAAMWVSWGKMTGQNTPLTRSTTGCADFDYNLDGLAHYGLLPDLLQDAKNLGMTEAELAVLFQSAEDFLQMWERSEAAAETVKKALPPSICDTEPAACTCDAVAAQMRDGEIDPDLLRLATPKKRAGR